MDKDMKEYRKQLVLAVKESQQGFDKTVFALSGGAIGISFAFITDIVDPKTMVNTCLLLSSWIAWGTSLTCVLAAYYVSHLALRKTIKQVDNNLITVERPGGFYDTLTAILNASGGLLFVIGLVFIIVFVSNNL